MFGKKVEYCSENSFRIQYLEKKVGRAEIENYNMRGNIILLESEVKELRNILKEAGIIVTPPKNISVPDPRGYSVNKIK